MNELLKNEILALCSVMSVSGFEPRATQVLRQMVGGHFDRTVTDAVGNHVFFKQCNDPSAPTVLIDAHFDEIGMVVTKHLDNGFLKLTNVGGLSPSVLQGADVVIYGREEIRGVITSTPPHLRSGTEDRLPDLEELMVDTGYPTEELKVIAPVGTPVGFAPSYRTLGESCLAGKSFDNKACAAIAAYAVVLYHLGARQPVIDSCTTILSVTAMLLTLKRCIEQWLLWTAVNLLSVVMWFRVYLNGGESIATLLWWAIMLVSGIIFFCQWKKQIAREEKIADCC